MLLQPGAPFSKLVSGAGRWSVSRSEYGQAFFCVILHGSARLAVDGPTPIVLQKGDFVLIPSARDFTMSDTETATPEAINGSISGLIQGEIRHGNQDGPPDVQLRVGYCTFGSPDAALLISLLPQLVHIRNEARLGTLAQLVGEESRVQRSACDVILARLLEVLLIEALRSTQTAVSPGLLRGLVDERLLSAIRAMHEAPTQRWTIAMLAKEAALSRSAFFERFSRAGGCRPDRVSARLAHGDCQEPAAAQGRRYRRSRRTRRLRVGQRVQRRLHPLRRIDAELLCAGECVSLTVAWAIEGSPAVIGGGRF